MIQLLVIDLRTMQQVERKFSSAGLWTSNYLMVHSDHQRTLGLTWSWFSASSLALPCNLRWYLTASVPVQYRADHIFDSADEASARPSLNFIDY